MAEIDFSCEEIPVEKVLQCSLGLRAKELAILQGLEGEKSAERVAQEFGVSKNYAQRILKNLSDKGLVERRAYNLASGGYIYEYQRKERDEIIDDVLSTLEGWYNRAKETIRQDGL